MVVLGGGGVSFERGTPVPLAPRPSWDSPSSWRTRSSTSPLLFFWKSQVNFFPVDTFDHSARRPPLSSLSQVVAAGKSLLALLAKPFTSHARVRGLSDLGKMRGGGRGLRGGKPSTLNPKS